MSSDLQIAFHKSNKNLKFRSKTIVLKISQSMITRKKCVYSLDKSLNVFFKRRNHFFTKFVYQNYHHIEFILRK